MSLAASPPPVPPSAAKYDQMNDDLDGDIKAIRAEIQALTQRRSLLSSTILNSSKVQQQLKAQLTSEDLPEDITPLLNDAHHHAEQNVHRLAFGVTSFPFTDPNPETSDKRLLGIRIDVCGRDGKYGKPHYVLCKRMEDDGTVMRIYRHTIPAFIPLKDYEGQYLPIQDEGYGSESSADGSHVLKQDLHSLVQKLRHDLVSWHLRRNAIDLLNEQLGLPQSNEQDTDMAEEDAGDDVIRPKKRNGRFGVSSVSAVSLEAQYAKIVWADGRVGRVKISDDGKIVRAVVFGEEGRIRGAERLLSEGNVRVQDLARSLEMLHNEAAHKRD